MLDNRKYRNNNENNNSSDFLYWCLVVGLSLLGLWPVSAILIYIKLFGKKNRTVTRDYAPSLSREEEIRKTEEFKKEVEKELAAQKAKDKIKSLFKAPKEDKKSAILRIALGVIFALIIIGSAGTVTISNATLTQLVIFISGLLSSAGLLLSGLQVNFALKRYAQYLSIIGSKDAMEISLIASKTGYKVKKVEKDIQRMIEKGYFGPTAYINKELGYFFKSNEADEELVEAKKAAFAKAKQAADSEALKQSSNIYEQLILQIRDVNNRIPGEVMTEKIYKLEDITKHIFDIVQNDPKKRPKIDRFMSYYLPTTLKLLDHYAKLDQTKIEGENISQSKKSIETAMDSIVDGFQRQLDDLYQTEALDIETDLDVLTQMMERDIKNKKSEFDVKNTNQTAVSGGH